VLLCEKCSLFLQKFAIELREGFEPVCAINGIFGVRPRVYLVELGEVLSKACEFGFLLCG